MMFRNVLLVILFSFFNSSSFADVLNATGTIDKVQLMGTEYESYSTSGKAIVFIHMSELPKSCDRDYRRVAITSDHPAFQVVVSSALAAKAAGQRVTLYYIDECTLWNSNAWDFSMIHVE